jgi:RNA polymerase sigma-70 factor, ECF subfamily
MTAAIIERPVAPEPEPGTATGEAWELIRRAQAGDVDAFAVFYQRYVKQIFQFVYFRTGNWHVAEDLTGEVFLRAFKTIGRFTWQGRDPAAWLVTIARNQVADYFKSHRYRREAATGDLLAVDREDASAEGNPETATLDHLTNLTLLRTVRLLNPEQRECIVLRYVRGLSVAETARAMDRNEGAVKALQYRAVRALARLLPPEAVIA